MNDRQSWSAGQWNSYVERGTTKEDRKSRLEEVPISLREGVKRHVQTIFDIRKYHEKRKERKK